MSLIFRLLLAALVHIAFFACYPDTGPNGKLYLIVSALAWSGFLIALNAGIKFFRFISGLLGLALNAAFFALMAAAIALTMPQKDGVAVMEKARNEKPPDLDSIKKGLKKLTGYYEETMDAEPGKEIKKAADKLQKDIKSGRIYK